MLVRCYDNTSQRLNPAYVGVTVCKDWLKFSNFKSWMETQTWEGLQLDKDIIKVGNKIYAPETCCFVSSALNNMVEGRVTEGKSLPTGVTQRESGMYSARIRLYSKQTPLGTYKTVEEAHKAYVKAKCDYLEFEADKLKDTRIKDGLYRHVITLRARLLS